MQNNLESGSASQWDVAIDDFADCVIDLLESSFDDINSSVACERSIMAALLRKVDAPTAPCDPKTMPVCRFLKGAISSGVRGYASQAALSDACNRIADGLHWRNKYEKLPRYEHLFRNFAFCDVMGPDGSRNSETVTLGLVLIGPETFYPLHQHPARELYYVIAGHAEWAVDGEAFDMRPPGSFILHTEDQPHAMKTSHEPLLALSMWRGDIRKPSRFTA